METTNQLLDAIKARYGLPSDYALAAKLNLTRSMVSAYRQGKRNLGDEPALKVAELLDLDSGYVLACMEAERSHSPAAAAAWSKLADLAKTYGAAAALLLLVVAPALSPTPANAAQPAGNGGVCILCKIRRAFAWLASSIAPAGRFTWHDPAPL